MGTVAFLLQCMCLRNAFFIDVGFISLPTVISKPMMSLFTFLLQTVANSNIGSCQNHTQVSPNLISPPVNGGGLNILSPQEGNFASREGRHLFTVTSLNRELTLDNDLWTGS